LIPLRDENPSGSTPYVTYGLIALNVLVFLYEVSLGSALTQFATTWGLIPRLATRALGGGGDLLWDAVVPAGTSMFLHGGWLHLIGNCWYLWIFGDNVEDRLGHLRYLVFYLGAGLASGALHVASSPGSVVPTVGASGAIAGVLGAYLLMFPRARVVTLVPLFVFIQLMALPAVLVLGLWFVFQFFSGAMSLLYSTNQSGGVAWWGHIGGFTFGVLVTLAFGLRAPRRSRAWAEE
jgi:membrane associated rhomboid family serine protease